VVIILNNKKINECIEDLEKNLFAQQIFSIFPMSSVIQLRWVVSGTFLCNLHMILWTDHPSSLRRQLSHRHRLLGLGYKMLEINTQLSKKLSGHLITTYKKIIHIPNPDPHPNRNPNLNPNPNSNPNRGLCLLLLGTWVEFSAWA